MPVGKFGLGLQSRRNREPGREVDQQRCGEPLYCGEGFDRSFRLAEEPQQSTPQDNEEEESHSRSGAIGEHILPAGITAGNIQLRELNRVRQKEPGDPSTKKVAVRDFPFSKSFSDKPNPSGMNSSTFRKSSKTPGCFPKVLPKRKGEPPSGSLAWDMNLNGKHVRKRIPTVAAIKIRFDHSGKSDRKFGWVA